MKSIAILALLCATPSWAESAGPRLSLDEILVYAQSNPGLEAAREAVTGVMSRLDEARRALWPQGTLSAFVAPAPEIRCEPSEALCIRTNSADLTNFEIAGVFSRMELKLAQPLYTFGKLSSARQAAEQGVRASAAQLEIARHDLAYDVVRAYYGLKLAKEILFTIEEGQGYLRKAIERIEEQLETGKGDATEADRLRLRVLEAEIDARLGEARRLADTTLAVLRTLANTAPQGFDIDEAPLQAEQREVHDKGSYLTQAQRDRPEIVALDAGLGVRRALENLEWGRFFPDLALVGQLAWAYAPSVDDPENAFASSQFNTLSGGVGALLSLQLDHPLKLARYRRAQSERRELELRRKQALDGIALEVSKTVDEVAEARTRLEATARGEKAARSWLVATYQNLMLGLVEPKDLTDALLAFFTLRLRYLQAIYDVNVGNAALNRATGVGP